MKTEGAAVRGYVDGLKGAFVAGWAISTQRQVCDIVVADEAHRVVATGQACLERPDLASLGAGRSNFAFSVPVPEMHRMRQVHVTADGVELQRSPQMLGAGIFDGQVALVRGRIEGWVAERVLGGRAPEVRVVDQDGVVVLECGGQFDAGGAKLLFAPARFAADMPARFFGRREIRLTAFAGHMKFAEATCGLPVRGYVEEVSARRVTGWLLAPGALARALEFDVWRDGVKLCTAACDLARGDLQAAYPGARRGGFDVQLPELTGGLLASCVVSFRFAGSDFELFDGPYWVGERAGVVDAARRAAGALKGEEGAVMRAALGDFLARARGAERLALPRQAAAYDGRMPRLNIVIPVYRGVQVTKACIESVLACREAGVRVILVNDASPDEGMAGLMNGYSGRPDLAVLTNEKNLGFVKSANRGIDFAGDGDVVLLNSDTVVFAGGLAELQGVAYGDARIATVTAISNNATMFSYPHPALRGETLADIGWEALARVALKQNAGLAIDVPTGHGFCLFMKRTALDQVGHLDEAFGRGYGEENDFCARAADLGFRNVAAPGALVEHKESVSFAEDKTALLAGNLAILAKRYPEYLPTIAEVQRRDDLRSGRWALDTARLKRAHEAGARFALVVCNSLGGGTGQAIADIEEAVGYGTRTALTLRCRADGVMELTAAAPAVRAVFAADETDDLLCVLTASGADLVLVHQVLGFSVDFIERFGAWVKGLRSVFYGHDFYPLCPRVTMIDAVERFCGLADVDVCARCVAVGGAHEFSRFEGVSPAAHRTAFAGFLGAFGQVVAPSESAAAYYRAAFEGLAVEALPHPLPARGAAAVLRRRAGPEVVLLGAIGAHKGSAALLEIAGLARLTHPRLRFRVIGHTNVDDALRRLGNVTITGPYAPGELEELAKAAEGRVALFLSAWPETFSYTLSEVVRLGFAPLLPDIGAPAERVRSAGIGEVFGFPVVANEVLAALARWVDKPAGEGASPAQVAAFLAPTGAVARTRILYGLDAAVSARTKTRPKTHKVKR